MKEKQAQMAIVNAKAADALALKADQHLMINA